MTDDTPTTRSPQPEAHDSQADQAQADRRRLGLETMSQVYGMEFADGPGDFFAMTADHLFAEVWTRDGLTHRERRLLLLGLLTGQGLDDVAAMQMGAALGNDELDADELREIVIFLTHYAGWPLGAKLNTHAEAAIARAEKDA